MGSLAEWAAAIGTVGTLFMSLHIFNRQRSQDQERIAQELVAHWTYWGEPEITAEGRAEMAELEAAGEEPEEAAFLNVPDIVLRVQNLGLAPIYFASLKIVGVDKSTYCQEIDLTEDGKSPLFPGILTELTVHQVAHDELVTVFVWYQDRTNKSWWRNVGTGEFVTKHEELTAVRGAHEAGRQYEVSRTAKV